MLSGGKGGKRAGFMLGRWTVLPDRNAIDGPGGRRPLEPMGMRLLLLLARRAPETVTRDEMIDALWQGRVVTDDAVNKQVSKLRAALAYQAADQNLIETVPKVGVRLTVSPAPIPALLKPHAWLLPAIFAVVAVALTAALFLVLLPRTAEVSEEPLTTLPGAEFDPALSRDGSWFAYVARARSGERALLYFRGIAGNQPTRISPSDADAAAPSWGPNGNLAFIARTRGECRIYVREPSGTLRSAAACVAAEFGGLAWLDARHLIVSDRAGVGKSYRLRILDLASGRNQPLAAPPSGDIGDSKPVVSRDRKAIYFLRSTTVGTGELMRMGLADGKVDLLSSNAGQISGFALGPGESLIISTDRGADGPALWQLQVSGRRWARLSPGAAPGLTGTADGRLLAFSRIERQTVLWRLPLNSADAGKPLTPSTRSDWSPVLAPDGQTLAFLSNRTGSEEVWLLDVAKGASRQLTRFHGPKLQDIAWSADSTMLLTSVPNEGQFDIFLVDKASGASRPIATSPLDERHGSFSADGRAVLLVRRAGSKFELRRYDLLSGKDALVLPSVMRLVSNGMGGPLVFTRPFEDGVWIAEGRAAPRKLLPFPDVTRMRDIVAGKTQLWTVRPDEKAMRLVSVDFRTGEQHDFRILPGMARPSGIAIVGNSVVYARSMRLEADLYALRLKD